MDIDSILIGRRVPKTLSLPIPMVELIEERGRVIGRGQESNATIDLIYKGLLWEAQSDKATEPGM